MKARVILADPPWHYQNYGSEPGTMHNRQRGAQKYYLTMTIDQLCALPVIDIAADNAALFMWSTWPQMPEALRLIDAWGFVYKTLAWEWVKFNSNSMGIFVGMGNYTRSNPEPCLLAFRGDPIPVAVHDVSSVIMSPVQEHSRKPSQQYERIESLYPQGPYLELFARRARAGWGVWGNEVESTISLKEPPATQKAQVSG
jgi:N6-adenosine-specific RNA methylase IME4